MQQSPEKLAKQKSWAYRRLIVGGVYGGVAAFAIGYLWATMNNNVNPVAGLGLVVLSSVGIVVGALLSLLSRKAHVNGRLNRTLIKRLDQAHCGRSVARKRIKINKLDVAVVQLQVAIDMFLSKKDLFCVITLAGAAEEILGQYASRTNEIKMIDELCSSLKEEHNIDMPDYLFKKKVLNMARNTLKHFGKDEAESIEIEPENEAITMLLRAIGNLYLHDQSLTSNTPDFLLWLMENRKDFFSKVQP